MTTPPRRNPSRLRMEWTKNPPAPGMLKTVSTTIDPVIQRRLGDALQGALRCRGCLQQRVEDKGEPGVGAGAFGDLAGDRGDGGGHGLMLLVAA